jgi:hypothetical protein
MPLGCVSRRGRSRSGNACLAGQAALAALTLLRDEMLSAVIAEQLRARGHDIEAINGNLLHEALSDSDVLRVVRTGIALSSRTTSSCSVCLTTTRSCPGGDRHVGVVS